MSIATNSDEVTLEGDGISRNRFAFGDNEDGSEGNSPFIRQLLRIKTSKFFSAVSVVLIIALAFIIIVTLTLSKSNHTNEPINNNNDSSNKKQINLLRSIVISSKKGLWTFDVDSKKCSPLRNLTGEVVALDTYLEETIFWSDNRTTSVINSLWPERHPNVSHTKRLKSQAIAVDYVTDKLYFVDRDSGSLGIADMRRRQNFGLVYSDLEQPHDLVLDPAEGLMFVVQFYKSIIKANMDGSSLKTIVESPKVSAITIDRKATRIYWSNDQTSIESSEYDGSNRQTVISIPMSVLSLTIMENQLFWTRSYDWSDMCPCSNVLWSCSLYRRSCSNVSSHLLPFDEPKLLRTSYDQHRHLVKNPCDRQNGGCEQLCLMTSKGSHDCACNVGWSLNPDGRSCSNVTKLMLYVQGEYVRARLLGIQRNESFVSAIVPTKLRFSAVFSIHFDYDMASGEFYFSENASVNRLNLLKDDEQTVLLRVPDNYSIRDLVYDWSKESIFYVKQSHESTNNHSIVMYGLKAGSQKVVLSSKFKKEAYIDCPHHLVIEPNHEYLFFADYNGVSDNLRRVSTNGKGLTLWKPFYSNVQLVLLTIDSERSRLYWSTSVSNSMIKSANLEGSEEETVQVLSVANLLYAGLKDWLYVGNHTEIYAVKRDNGADPRVLVKKRLSKVGVYTSYNVIYGLRIYSQAARNVT